MEPIGLAVGVVGLAGLFSSCLEAVDRVQSYLHFEGDNHVLDTKFAAARVQLERWGRQVGFNDGELLADHHPALDDADISAAVVSLVTITKTICNASDPVPRHPKYTNSGFIGGPHNLFHPKAVPAAESKRQKLAWALWGKKEREEQVNMFRDLVQELHNLVPLTSIIGSEQPGKPSTGLDNQNTIQDHSAFIGSLQTLQRIESRIQTKMMAEARRDVTLWLMGSQLPDERFEESNRKRLDGTCGWILDRREFSEWVSPSVNNTKVLWITGPAGFGKTILCASIARHLSTTLDSPVAHYFFSSSTRNDDDNYVAIRSWVSQLSSSDEKAFQVVHSAWEDSTDQLSSRTTIQNIFRELLQSIPGCTLIADGLDEIPSISRFLEAVLDAATGTNTRILMVSRDEIMIRQALMGHPEVNCTEYKILLEDVQNDTKACSRSIVDRKLPNKSEDIRTDLSGTMAARCEGQFLWLELQEETLRKGMSKKQLERAISDAPAGLERLYDQNWKKITEFREAEKVRAFTLLRWAAFAQRPLTVSEVTGAVLIHDEMDELMVDDLPDDVDNDYIETEIVGLCASLLEVKAQTPEQPAGLRILQLKHFSVKQYLLSHLPLPSWISANERLQLSFEQMQNSMLAKLCLQYINLPIVWMERTEEQPLPLEISFRQYASLFWHKHLKSGSESVAELAALTRKFFERGNPPWISWSIWFESQNSAKIDSDTALQDPLYYAIKLGLKHTALALLENEELDLRGSTPTGRLVTVEACGSGEIEIVKKLFEKGADVASRIKHGWTCLMNASHYGHVDIVKLLLKMNADVSEQDCHKSTPLYIAARYGYLEVAKILVEHGADLNAVQQQGWTPVSAASNENLYNMVQLLVDKGADINIAALDGWTPLLLAASKGYTEIVKLLIDYGADFKTGNRGGLTPLGFASRYGFTETVKLLLDHGADMEKGNSIETHPLQSASDWGHTETVKLLLDRGAKIEAETHEGWRPLMIAVHSGHLKTVKLLLQYHAAVNASMKDGWTSLHWASSKGHSEIVRLLLEQPANIEAVVTDGWASLHLASYGGHTEVVKLLLSHGAKVNQANGSSRTPLLLASRAGHIEVVQALLDYRASMSGSEPPEGLTPLMEAATGGHTEVARLLVESGADIAVTNVKGQSALVSASDNGHAEIVRFLLDHGADISAACSCEWTPLMYASRCDNPDVAHVLIEKGASALESTTDGRSALSIAIEYARNEVAELLITNGAGDTRPTSGWAPLLIASKTGNIDGVKLLLKSARIRPGVTDNQGRTALFMAARFGNLEVVRILLDDSGIDSDATDFYGSTALFAAVRNGHADTVALLFAAKGPSWHMQDGFGRSLEWWARRFGQSETIQLLGENADQPIPPVGDGGSALSESIPITFSPDVVWCNCCTLSIPGVETYTCDLCDPFVLTLCKDCFNQGFRCLDKSHKLQHKIPAINN